MRALVKFMFVCLLVLQSASIRLLLLVKSVQGCNLLLYVIGTEPMPVAKLAMV